MTLILENPLTLSATMIYFMIHLTVNHAFRICNGQRLTRFKHANFPFGEYILESYALLHAQSTEVYKPCE